DLPTQYNLPGNFSGYEWSASNNGTITQGQGTNAATVLWNTPGANTLTVYFTNASNCPDSAVLNLSVNICVGTTAPTIPGVRVMPNPFSDRLSVVFERPVQPGTRLRLTDTQGRLITEQFAITDQTRLETAYLPAGAYLLQVVENGRVGVWKVVKTDK
ncbi:MAG: T9SS type A sorting domain-containing protein, partial [Thermoanaerobaculia bacterium]|nr:T9SS type A sorting domain-containing protein [Thermoanaerobaculia bacterium]